MKVDLSFCEKILEMMIDPELGLALPRRKLSVCSLPR